MDTMADKTFIYSPHKLFGPQVSELSLQLGKPLFEVAVVRDAIAGPKLPEG